MYKFDQKNQHRATTAATVAVVAAVAVQIVVSCSNTGRARGGCLGASGASDRPSIFWRVTFFLYPFLGLLLLFLCFLVFLLRKRDFLMF